MALIIHWACWGVRYIITSIFVQQSHHHYIHQLPLHVSFLARNCHLFTAKLVFVLSQHCINFVSTLPLLVLMLPLLRLNPTLMHHHAHLAPKQKFIFIAVIHMMRRLLPYGFKRHRKGIAFFLSPIPHLLGSLNSLFHCTMMRGGCGKIILGQEHQDGGRKVVTWRLFHVYGFCCKITSPGQPGRGVYRDSLFCVNFTFVYVKFSELGKNRAKILCF